MKKKKVVKSSIKPIANAIAKRKQVSNKVVPKPKTTPIKHIKGTASSKIISAASVIKSNSDVKVDNKKDQVTMTRRTFNSYMDLVNNTATLSRSIDLQRLLNPGPDIDYECRYPDKLSMDDYQKQWDREGVAARVVKVWPEESWAMNPDIKEDDSVTKTDFEKKWDEIQKDKRIFNHLLRVDILSGIGEFGVLLFGLSGEGTLEDPVEGIYPVTGKVSENKVERELLFLKPYSQTAVKIVSTETEITSPRFGLPVLYEISFEDTEGGTTVSKAKKVHWTRILHVADNRETSDIHGRPRMQQNFNRLKDLRKIYAGSGEMFWKGGFMGLGFETRPENDDATIDTDSLKDTMRQYGDGLQRFVAVQGMNIKSIAPQLADPTGHVKVNLQAIAISEGIPLRILMGTEEGKLAGGQDAKAWNKRVDKRREDYCTPLLLNPCIDRLIAYGVLPEPTEYMVIWPDLDAPSDKEKMDVAKLATEALAKYVQADVQQLMSPEMYYIHILNFSEDLAKKLVDASAGFVDDAEPENNNEDDTNE